MIYNNLFLAFLNEPELTCLPLLNTFKYCYLTLIVQSAHSKWFSVLLSYTNSSVCTQLNTFEYFYQTLILLFA